MIRRRRRRRGIGLDENRGPCPVVGPAPVTAGVTDDTAVRNIQNTTTVLRGGRTAAGAGVGPSNSKIHHFIHRHVFIDFIDRVRIDGLVILLVKGDRSTSPKRRVGVISVAGCCPHRLTRGTALTVLLGRNERIRLVSRRGVVAAQVRLLQVFRILPVLRWSDRSYARFHEETTFLATAASAAGTAGTLTAFAMATVVINVVLHGLVPFVPAVAAAITVAVCPGTETR